MCHHWRSLLGLNGQWSALGPAQGAGHVRCRGAAVAGRAGVWGSLNWGGENQPAHRRVSRGGLRSNSGHPLGLAKGCSWSSAGAGAGVAGRRHLAELLSLASLVRAVLLLWQRRGCVVDRGAWGELHCGGGGVLHRGRPGGGRVLHWAPGVGCWRVLHRRPSCRHCTVLGSHHLLAANHAAVLQWRRCWRACCRARRWCLWWRRRYEGGVIVAIGVHHTGLAGSDNLVGGHAGRLDRGHAGGRRL